MSKSSSNGSRIAIVGMSALFPGSNDAEGFWRDIVAGRDLVTDVPPDHWLIEDYFDEDPQAEDKTYARRGAFLNDVAFDPMAFGVPPTVVPTTDTAQLLALIVAQRVLDDAARGQFEAMNRDRISVILGVTSAQELLGSMVSRLQRPVWTKALREAGLPETKVQEACDRIAAEYVPWRESTFPGLLGNVVAGRIANRLDLGGTNCVTDAACASTFSALGMAVNELRLGQSDLVITGGVDTMNDIFMYVCFSKTPALSPTGDCRPFSDRADGTLLGEGLAMFALKRLEDAERDGDRIYALVTGVGSSSDGRAKSVYAPRSEGQARALRRAYETAGYGPETVELVEAHGTGTKAGDVAEVDGLKSVFGADGGVEPRRQWCALGSVKSQIGHTKAAAGAAGLFKAVMALRHKVLPPTIKIDCPNPKLGLEDSPFYLNTTARPWIRGAAHPRRAGVSAFGFGGSNFHVTVEEYVRTEHQAARKRVMPSELFVIGEDSPRALVERVKEIDLEPGLGSLAWKSQEDLGSDTRVRLAIAASDDDDFREKLRRATEWIEGHPDEALSTPTGIHYAPEPMPGTLAFLFPGQGSQYLNMGADLLMSFEDSLAPWNLASELDWGESDRLHEVVFPKPAFNADTEKAHNARVIDTRWAQPAIAACSLSQLVLLERLGLSPDCVAGHSFGEVMALHAAGAFDMATTLNIARRRGELMSEAADSPGSMLAVVAPIEQVRELIEEVGSEVVVANHNAPKQVVLSGATGAVEQLQERLTQEGLVARRLPVSTAFHSPIVSGSATSFASYLGTVAVADLERPVYADRTAEPYSRKPREIRAGLAKQIASPVRFVEIVEAMYASGVRTFLEVGPGSVLTGLVAEILHDRTHAAVSVDQKGRSAVTALHNALARLWVGGADIAFTSLRQGYDRPEARDGEKASELSIRINGTNCQKPYPPAGGAADLPGPNPERTPHREAAPSIPSVASSSSIPSNHDNEPVAAQHIEPISPRPLDKDLSPWLEAFQEVQRQTAEAHTAWQSSMHDAHRAYLQASERTLVELSAFARGGAHDMSTVTAAMPAVQPGPRAEPTAPTELFVASESIAETTRAAEEVPHVEAPPARPTVSVPEVASPPKLDELLLGIVAESTGYPVEMLGLDMNLESDLGVDSIKRVEILASINEQAPELADADPTTMATLGTLGEIAEYLQGDRAGAPQTGTKTAPESTPLNRYRVEAHEVVSAGFVTAGLSDATTVYVTPKGSGVAEAVVKRLMARGIDARCQSDVPSNASALLCLEGLSEVDSVDAAIDINRGAFAAARVVAESFARGGGIFCTVQDTGGDFGLSGSERAWLGGLSGLVKTAAREWPSAAVKAMDIERAGRSDDELAEVILGELYYGGPEIEVGIRADGTRTTLRSMPEQLVAGDDCVREDSVVVATGGARGVTAAAMIELGRRTRCRLALLGRTDLVDEPEACHGVADAALDQILMRSTREQGGEPTIPEIRRESSRIRANREIRATLSALEDAGVEAKYLAVDVRDPAALSGVLDGVRASWGPITGVVHGAGVLRDKLIADKTEAQFRDVFDTKVIGLRNLLAATREDPIELLCSFSSIAARAGNAGQSDYAMANEILNKVAWAEAHRRGVGCLVKSIDWGPWDAGMVTPELKDRFEASGVTLIPLGQGAEAMLDETRDNDRLSVEVVLGGVEPVTPLLVAGRDFRPLSEIWVSESSHPYLAHHTIEDVPVLPVVMVLEWFTRVARALSPEVDFVACNGLKVLKGARLGSFLGAGDRFVILARRSHGLAAPIELALRGADGSLHYTATAAPAPGAPDILSPGVADLDLMDWRSDAAIYGGALFHGPDFQVIESVDGVGGDGIAGVIHGTLHKGWIDGVWRTDVAALDGGLQLAVLWTEHVLKCKSLPTTVGAYHGYVPQLPDEPIRCVVRGKVLGGSKTRCDISFTGSDGRALARLEGVETHLLPS